MMSLGQSRLDICGNSDTKDIFINTTLREVTLEKKYQAKIAAWKRNPKILKTSHHFFEGDSRKMEGLDADKEVHLIVTSPPYWNLKKIF